MAVKANLKDVYKSSQFLEWLNVSDSNGENPLHFAIKYKQEITASQLFEAGSHCHSQNNRGESALHFAVRDSLHSLLQQMCAAAADTRWFMNAENSDGETPLHMACRLGHLDCVRVLLKFGADAFASGPLATGLPVHYALKYQQTEVLRTLLEHDSGVLLLGCRKHKGLPLHWCKTMEQVEVGSGGFLRLSI